MSRRLSSIVSALLLVACNGEGSADDAPMLDAGPIADAGLPSPEATFTFLAGVGDRPGGEGSGPLMILGEADGGLRGAALGFEVLVADGTSFGYDRDTQFFGALPFDPETLLTYGADTRLATRDHRWFFVESSSFVNGESVEGPAWFDRETGTVVPWLPEAFRPSVLQPDGTGRLWATALAEAPLTVAGTAVESDQPFLVAITAAGIERAIPYGRSVSPDAFWITPDGQLVLVVTGWRDTGGELFGEPLLARQSAIARIDLESGTLIDRWDSTMALHVEEGAEGAFRIHGQVSAATETIGGESYAALAVPTWVVIDWDGTGALPAAERWPVSPTTVDSGGHVSELGLPGQERAITLAAETLGPADGEPIWGRLDADGRLALGVRGKNVHDRGGLVWDGVLVTAVSEATVEVGGSRFEPLAGAPRTMHLVFMDPATGAISRHAAVPGAAWDARGATSAILLDPTHAIITREAEDAPPEHSLVSLVTGASRTLDPPVIDGPGCDWALIPLDHRAELLPGWLPRRDVVSVLARCEGDGHTVSFGGESFTYQGRASQTAFRVTVDD